MIGINQRLRRRQKGEIGIIMQIPDDSNSVSFDGIINAMRTSKNHTAKTPEGGSEEGSMVDCGGRVDNDKN